MRLLPNTPIFKLSDPQKILLVTQIFSIEKRSVKEANIISGFFRIPENCNFEALEKAFNKVIERNDALRLRIFFKKFGIYQYIEKFSPVKLNVVKLENSDSAFDEYVRSIYCHRIKLFNNNLVWAEIAAMGTSGVLMMRFHHACVDGLSMSLIFKQLETYYDCFANNEELPEEKEYSVTQYFLNEAKYRQSQQHTKDRLFWKNSFNSQREYRFPAGHRSEFGSSSRLSTVISGDTYDKLIRFCHANNCSMQAALMSFSAILTYCETNADNFCIYSLTHGRHTPALKQTVGCMMNVVPTFFDIDVNMTVNEFAQDSYMRILTHLSHGKFATTEMNSLIYKESIKNFFNFNHAWLMFSVMDLAVTQSKLKYQADLLPHRNTPYQFYCAVLETPGESVRINLSYQIHKFKEKQVSTLLKNFDRLVELAVNNPEMTVKELKAVM